MKGPKQKGIISLEILKLGFFSGSERKNNERGTRIDHISEITNLFTYYDKFSYFK